MPSVSTAAAPTGTAIALSAAKPEPSTVHRPRVALRSPSLTPRPTRTSTPPSVASFLPPTR
eukprot:3917602-Pleurochrysis_carterae.AAC.1